LAIAAKHGWFRSLPSAKVKKQRKHLYGNMRATEQIWNTAQNTKEVRDV